MPKQPFRLRQIEFLEMAGATTTRNALLPKMEAGINVQGEACIVPLTG